MAIAQFSRCNIECNYCYLQTQDRSVFEAGFDPYEVLPAIKGLVRGGACARKLVVDWGGGEPTVYGEFDRTLEFLTGGGDDVGAFEWDEIAEADCQGDGDEAGEYFVFGGRGDAGDVEAD